MTYKIEYLVSVIEEDIPRISRADRDRLRRAVEDKLTRDPVVFGKPLQYSLKGCRRLRVGDYRIIFQIDDNKTVVGREANRRVEFVIVPCKEAQ